MKKKHTSRKTVFTVQFADESSALDRKLRPLADLCCDADPFSVNPEVINDLGYLVLDYLESRLSLEYVAYQRTVPGLLGNSDSFWEKVAIYRKRLRESK